MPRLFLAPMLAALGMIALPADAQETAFTLTGGFQGWMRSSETGATALVPDPGAQGYRSATLRADLIVQPKWDWGALTAQAQARLTVQGGTENEAVLDEAFLRYAATETLFVTLGRRNLSYGQAYGLNPADLFRLPLAEPDVYSSDAARSLAGSADLVQAEWLFASGGAVQLVLAREDPAGGDTAFPMARLSGMLAAGKLDYALSGFGGDRPGMGLSFSYGLGEASVLYLDSTLRRGRDRDTIRGLGPDGSLELIPGDAQAWRGFATLGIGHTFGSGLTLNAELSHDASGLSDAEWQRVGEALAGLTPVTSATQGRALGALNGALNHYTQRRNYAFLRLSQDGIGSTGLSGEMTLLHGLDDGSGTLGLRLEHPLGDTARLGLAVTQTYGGSGDEFRLRPDHSSVAVYTMVTF